MADKQYRITVDVDGGKSTGHGFHTVYEGTSIPDAMAAWSQAVSEEAGYVVLEAVRSTGIETLPPL